MAEKIKGVRRSLRSLTEFASQTRYVGLRGVPR